MKSLFLFFLIPLGLTAQTFKEEEVAAWQKQAEEVTIIRDDWGVPHIYGKTDADAAFGLMYSQCEDNYWQMEETFISALGRRSEIYGESGLDNDLNVALFRARTEGKRMYSEADQFIKQLCDAAAAGINYYLHTNPEVERRLLDRYEPWFFLLPSGTSPTGHGITRQEIQRVMRANVKEESGETAADRVKNADIGSNMMAIAPAKSESGKPMLLINPHVSFFGGGQRYECHLVSRQGMNVSGFAMFGNFWIWSGFNNDIGWSHTNSGVDFTDVYLETFDHPEDSLKYRYGNQYKRAQLFTDTILYKTDTEMKRKVVTFMVTHRGPVLAKRDSFYVTVKNSTGPPPDYILQCWRMMKSGNLGEFTEAMNIRALGYPNTIYADRSGNIAYWHGNAIPKRSVEFDWQLPVDGSNPETDWNELHPLNEIISSVNPSSGWLQNCNSTPFLCAGSASPDSLKYPRYMAYDLQTFRAREAIRLLTGSEKISFQQFENLVVSTHFTLMENWLPGILNAYDRRVVADQPVYEELRDVIDTLRHWDCKAEINSKATSIGVFWFYAANNWVSGQQRAVAPSSVPPRRYFSEKDLPFSDSLTLSFMSAATDTLKNRYGSAFIEWGTINRLQRVHTSGELEMFDDLKLSLPVKGAPGPMGSLFAFSTEQTGTKKLYGTSGNSYVAVVEFDRKIKARSVVYFGQNADPTSPHYFDQAPLYAEGKFKDAWFYKKDVLNHAERVYHPGE